MSCIGYIYTKPGKLNVEFQGYNIIRTKHCNDKFIYLNT